MSEEDTQKTISHAFTLLVTGLLFMAATAILKGCIL